MTIISNIRHYQFVEEHDGYRVGQDIAFYYPITGEKGMMVVGTLVKILVNRTDGDDVYYRVLEGNIPTDYAVAEIVFPDDVDKDPTELRVAVKVSGERALARAAVLPEYATPGSSGVDFVALRNYELQPNRPVVIETGLRFEIPYGFEMQIRGRSSLGKRGIVIANGVGTVDSDYRGEVGVILNNLSSAPYLILEGDKIAQGIIAPVMRAKFVTVEELSATQRGEGGFGSTGK